MFKLYLVIKQIITKHIISFKKNKENEWSNIS
jgi:hypothetical protein